MGTRLASERMNILFHLATECIYDSPNLSRRYTALLRRIAQRTRTKLPPHIKHSICKKCNIPLIPGYNSTTRINQRREPHIATTCHTCGNITRRPLRSKTK